MQSQLFVPRTVLKPYVSHYIYCRPTEPEKESTQDFYATGHTVLRISLRDTPFVTKIDGEKNASTFNLVGQVEQPVKKTVCEVPALHAVLHPCGAFHLFDGIPQQDLLNDQVNMHDLLGTEATDFRQKLMSRKEKPDQLIHLLDSWLLKQYLKNNKLEIKAMDKACRVIKNEAGMLPIKELCAKVLMSPSSLKRYFNEQIGCCPKRYSRIIRFTEVYKALCKTTRQDWQEICYRFGYFDQNHFIKDFKAFFGYIPSQFQRHKNQFLSLVINNPAANEI